MTDCPRTVWYNTEKSTWVRSNQQVTRIDPVNDSDSYKEMFLSDAQYTSSKKTKLAIEIKWGLAF